MAEKVRSQINLSTMECETLNKKIDKSSILITQLITENKKKKNRPIFTIGLISAGSLLFFGYTLFKGKVPYTILMPLNSIVNAIFSNANNNNNNSTLPSTITTASPSVSPPIPPTQIIINTSNSDTNSETEDHHLVEIALITTAINIIKWLFKNRHLFKK